MAPKVRAAVMVYFDPADLERLDAYVATTGQSRVGVIRQAIEEKLARVGFDPLAKSAAE